jgi:hypothetical protein
MQLGLLAEANCFYKALQAFVLYLDKVFEIIVSRLYAYAIIATYARDRSRIRVTRYNIGANLLFIHDSLHRMTPAKISIP